MKCELELRGNVLDCRPRIVWQKMFDIYRNAGANMERMDNMLIDYDYLVRLLVKHETPIDIFWCFCYTSGQTTFIKQDRFFSDEESMVEWNLSTYDEGYFIVVDEFMEKVTFYSPKEYLARKKQ